MTLKQIKQNLIQQIKENIYSYQVEESIMDYYEVGPYGFWIDYTCDITWINGEPGEKYEMRINNLDVEVREVWDSKNRLLRNVTNKINKL